MRRGYFAIGIYRTKTEANVGTLWRAATLYDAAFVFTIGRRYRPQSSDTPKTPRHTPLFHFDDISDFKAHLPWSAPLIGVELADSAVPLPRFEHPQRAVYLLGAEDHGLPDHVLSECHSLVQIPTVGAASMNVSAAGSILLYDRHIKGTIAASQVVAS